MFRFQSTLSEAQAIPVLGPILVSPCKALVSLAQIVVGIASGVLFGSLTVITWSDWCAEKTLQSITHVGMGFMAFGYSLVNIFTLGIAAYQIEGARAGSGQMSRRYSY